MLVISAGATCAQEADDGPSLMERGARQFLEGLMREMEPALDGLNELGDQVGPALRDFADQMGPALADLLGQVDDWSVYHPPERLPNGDIIIRRKTPKPPAAPQAPEEQIDI